MSRRSELEIADPDAMREFGHRLARHLEPGMVIGLVGPLGAGKTFLVRAICSGLELQDERLVTSPTFVLIQEYPARIPVYHFDAYRLPNAEAFADLGVSEYFASDGVCLIEWADRVLPVLPNEHILIEIDITGESSRRIRLTAEGRKYELLLERLQAVG